ncbi:hypothetical protein MKX01_021059 [Papaver californicum]|nr:hypothetical protein MKX01_021059 [Papaver californicum]
MLPFLLDAKINKHMSGSASKKPITSGLEEGWGIRLSRGSGRSPARNLWMLDFHSIHAVDGKVVYPQKTCIPQGVFFCLQGKSLSYYWEGSLLANDCHQMGICNFWNIVSPTFDSLTIGYDVGRY